jgi:hypothetical protein
MPISALISMNWFSKTPCGSRSKPFQIEWTFFIRVAPGPFVAVLTCNSKLVSNQDTNVSFIGWKPCVMLIGPFKRSAYREHLLIVSGGGFHLHQRPKLVSKEHLKLRAIFSPSSESIAANDRSAGPVIDMPSWRTAAANINLISKEDHG